jgi:D-sedoheptulose 7-phosphate isomerase
MGSNFEEYVEKTISLLRASKYLESDINDSVITISKTVVNNRKIFICGNGGSAADSQHLAAELVGKFKLHGRAISAIALTVDTSVITAIANDFGYDQIFERQLSAHGNEGDCLIAISTSGNSANVVKAVKKAREMKLRTIALIGGDGGEMAGISDHEICIPSTETDLIQHVHLVIGHFLMSEVEKKFRAQL